MRHRTRAYIGLGSNVGDAPAALAGALRELAVIPGVRLAGVSRLYATRPVGMVDQPDFANAVAAVDVQHDAAPQAAALDLLRQLKRLEREAGRLPGPRWGPRPLDLDLLLFGRSRIRVERPPDLASSSPLSAPPGVHLLEIPHPAMRDRLFVLGPMADLAPRLVPPGWSETIGRARRRRAGIEGPRAVRVAGEWDPASGAWRLEPAPGSVVLRAADPGDAALVHDLTCAAYEEHRGRLNPPSGVFSEDVESIRRDLEAGGGLIALLDGRPVGCARFEPRPSLGHLYVGRVAVLPDARRRGIADALVRRCEELALALGLPRVRLGARLALPDNIRFYRDRGYRVTGYEERPGHGRFAVWLEKEIAPSGSGS